MGAHLRGEEEVDPAYRDLRGEGARAGQDPPSPPDAEAGEGGVAHVDEELDAGVEARHALHAPLAPGQGGGLSL